MNHAFSSYHPAVAFAFIVSAAALSMAAMHPVYVAFSLAGALATSAAVRGMRQTVRSLAWVLPMCAIMACANPLFSASGSTELFRVAGRAVYAESLVYGLCSGGMFASVFLWFSSYARCMNSENSLALLGNAAPTVSLMASQVLRLVPQFVSRGREISAVQDAASAAAPAGRKDEARGRFRVVSTLMEWGMEDGIVRTDAMRARGYDCGVRRTTYKRCRFGGEDRMLMACILIGAAANAVLIAIACAHHAFYPTMTPLHFQWGYAAYAAYLAIPPILKAKEWWQWRLSR
ncbi:MAG: energy-coupling factor transporter transmembrane component T [Slackia sp.]|nr:energy-coupling factor transporter transmembrane component T [Slackia sp.]